MNFCLRLAIYLIPTFVCSFAYGGNYYSVPDVSELRSNLPALKEAERLNALSIIYEHCCEYGDSESKFAALYPYLKEARRQGNIAEESYAQVQRIYLFYNNHMGDSLARYYPRTMAFLNRNAAWAEYYYVALLKVQHELFANRPLQALRYAQSLYEEAKIQDNGYGKGASSYIIGKVKLHGRHHTEAIPYLKDAIILLLDESDPTMLFLAYNELGEALYDEKQYEDALLILKQWNKALSDHYDMMVESNTLLSVANYEFYCSCALARVYSRLKAFPEARAELQKAEEKYKDNYINSTYLHRAKSVYCEETGDYAAAVSWFEKAMPSDESASLQEKYDSNLQYARLLSLVGRVEEASTVYEEAITYGEKLMDQQAVVQVDELGLRMEIDKLNARQRSRAVIVMVVLVSLLAILSVYFFYSRRIKSKNSALSEQLKEVSRLRMWQLSHLLVSEVHAIKSTSAVQIPPAIGKNEEIVSLACRRMIEDKKFRDPSLNRKQLADILGTNENYLASAIREVNNGQTVGDFINGFRLDYACNLIIERPNMTLDAIAHESGLVTRSTLFRLFLKKFGMSPSRYRNERLKIQ